MSAVTQYAVTAADLAGKGVIGLADTPGLTVAAMQAKFEETAREVLVPHLNNALAAAGAELDDRYTKAQTNAQIDAKMTAMGSGDMAKNVYDPNGRAKDIFTAGTGTAAGLVKLSDSLTDTASGVTAGTAATPKALAQLGAQKAPVSHASAAAGYGLATGTLYGHVRLSDRTDDSTGTATGGVAATPYAVKMAVLNLESKQGQTYWYYGMYVDGWGYKIIVPSLYPFATVTEVFWYSGIWNTATVKTIYRQGLCNIIDCNAPSGGSYSSGLVCLVKFTYTFA